MCVFCMLEYLQKCRTVISYNIAQPVTILGTSHIYYCSDSAIPNRVRVVDCHAGILGSNPGGPKDFSLWNCFNGGPCIHRIGPNHWIGPEIGYLAHF